MLLLLVIYLTVKSRMKMQPVGAAPTTSELSTILLPTKVRLTLDVLRYKLRYIITYHCVRKLEASCETIHRKRVIIHYLFILCHTMLGWQQRLYNKETCHVNKIGFMVRPIAAGAEPRLYGTGSTYKWQC